MDKDFSKESIVKVGKYLYDKDLTSGTSGNISVRCGDNFLITASGTALGFLEKKQIIEIDVNGYPVKNGEKPSSEKFLHLEIYKMRPDINAIIHVHPVMATVFATAHEPLNKANLAENMLYFGEIPLAEYAMPSSDDLVFNTAKYFKNHDAVLMANHGIIVGDKTIEHAFYKVETAENWAKLTLMSKLYGKEKLLRGKDIKDLEVLKANFN